MLRHPFTDVIASILSEYFGANATHIFNASYLIQYLNEKTRSANRGSKARGSFGSIFALYVLVEDYIAKGFSTTSVGQYSKYQGARFTDLLKRQRELPFGSRLQNHHLNARLNDEFTKFFPTIRQRPIIRAVEEQRYWINESLLMVSFIDTDGVGQTVNIAELIIRIADDYVAAKRSAFEAFIETCRRIGEIEKHGRVEAKDFIRDQLESNVDARIFEIVSFAILKVHYGEQEIYWGRSPDTLERAFLILYKTGRTNANDGGIDFVMRPLGRFFQVTENVDVSKFFLDIDKIQRFPLTFVVKASDSSDEIRESIKEQATKKYAIESIIQKYMSCVEEIINIPMLNDFLAEIVADDKTRDVMQEIIVQSKVEFNYINDEATQNLSEASAEDVEDIIDGLDE